MGQRLTDVHSDRGASPWDDMSLLPPTLNRERGLMRVTEGPDWQVFLGPQPRGGRWECRQEGLEGPKPVRAGGPHQPAWPWSSHGVGSTSWPWRGVCPSAHRWLVPLLAILCPHFPGPRQRQRLLRVALCLVGVGGGGFCQGGGLRSFPGSGLGLMREEDSGAVVMVRGGGAGIPGRMEPFCLSSSEPSVGALPGQHCPMARLQAVGALFPFWAPHCLVRTWGGHTAPRVPSGASWA